MPPAGLTHAIFICLGLAWLVILIAAPRLVARQIVRLPRPEQLGLLALVAGAFVLRLAVATWGPGDFVVRQFGAFEEHQPYSDLYHGNAPLALWRLVFLVLPATDTTIIAFGLLFATLAVPLVVLLTRELGADRLTAFGAGFLLALHPIAVRFAGDMSRVPHVLFLSALALWALAAYGRRRKSPLLVVFVLSAWLSARSRPEGAMVLGCAGLLLLVVHFDSWRRLRDRFFRRELVAVAACAVLIVGSLVIAGIYEPAIGRHLKVYEDPLWNPFTAKVTPWLDTDYTSIVAIELAVAGAVAAVLLPSRLGLWAVLCLAALAYVNPDRVVTQGLLLCNVRYHALPLLMFSVVAAFGAGRIGELAARLHGAWAKALAAGVLAVAVVSTSLVPLQEVCGARTIDHEYAFLRETIQKLPADAVIYFPLEDKGKNSFISSLRYVRIVSRIFGRGEWRLWSLRHPEIQDNPADERPRYFYQSPACSVGGVVLPNAQKSLARLQARCREGMARSGDRPVFVREIPRVPFAWERFTRDPVPIGFYQLSPPPD